MTTRSKRLLDKKSKTSSDTKPSNFSSLDFIDTDDDDVFLDDLNSQDETPNPDDEEDNYSDSHSTPKTRRRSARLVLSSSKKNGNSESVKKTKNSTPKKNGKRKVSRISKITELSNSDEDFDDDSPRRLENPAKPYDLLITKSLASEYPDTYWKHTTLDDEDGMIQFINDKSTLEALPKHFRNDGPILGMSLSPEGTMLATFCTYGSVKIWDVTTFEELCVLRDNDEKNLDEFYVGQFNADCTKLILGGKLKDRSKWSEQEDDLHIVDCPLKVFDLSKRKVTARFEGHKEEILSIKLVKFKNEDYILTTSQDGFVIKWKVSDDWSEVLEKTLLTQSFICMAFNTAFLPNTGNKYFLCACEDGIALWDFESGKILQMFEGIFSSYCDCVKFVSLTEDAKGVDSIMKDCNGMVSYLISRGVEILDAEDNTINTKPNTVNLHKLIYPTEKGGEFMLEIVRQYRHEDYHSNSWYTKIASNGRYIAAPTFNGQVFIFNIKSGAVTGILRDHKELEVRDVIFHPTRSLLFSCGDDGVVHIYRSSEPTVDDDELMIDFDDDM
ncbi:hypothetical protein HK098_001298 [Nowakowskiella sp. JEL0407]|nr:hypothetical protein HK098_001298 [Nowakowskiella sp. JEL0407]